MNHLIAFLIGVVSSIAASLLVKQLLERYSSRISFRTLLNDVVALYRAIKADEYAPDWIVGVDRNGSIVASLLSGYIGFRPIVVAATRTTHHFDSPREVQMSVDHLPPEPTFAGKRLLIVCCYVDTGSALETVYNYFVTLSEPPAEIRTAALYGTPSPRLKPRYLVHEVGKDMKTSIDEIAVRMPWAQDDWKLTPRGKRI